VAAYRIIALHGVSSFCYGLVFPFTGIFLADRPGIGTHGVALYYAVAGVANLAVALLLAMGVVRPPRVALGVIGNLLSFAGYLLMPSVGSLSAVGLAAAANGAGQGCFLAAVIPIVNSLVPEADRRRLFARRYQVLNATSRPRPGGSRCGDHRVVAAGDPLAVRGDRARYLLIACPVEPALSPCREQAARAAARSKPSGGVASQGVWRYRYSSSVSTRIQPVRRRRRWSPTS
jgi:hypothetical protein